MSHAVVITVGSILHYNFWFLYTYQLSKQAFVSIHDILCYFKESSHGSFCLCVCGENISTIQTCRSAVRGLFQLVLAVRIWC